jgi:hypothetical protein
MGTPDSPLVYEKPTEKAYLLIELVDLDGPIRFALPEEGETVGKRTKPGILSRFIRRFSGRPIR